MGKTSLNKAASRQKITPVLVAFILGIVLGTGVSTIYFLPQAITNWHTEANQSVATKKAPIDQAIEALTQTTSSSNKEQISNISEVDDSDIDSEKKDTQEERIRRLAKRWGIDEPNYNEAMLRLSNAGFNAFDAERIFEIESTAKYKLLDIMAKPEKPGGNSAREVWYDFSSAMRKEIGDYGYENYLQVNGQKTSVDIVSVSENSPAKVVGLNVGDQITYYAGERVFNIFDINDLTKAGPKNEPVIIEFLRDGQSQSAYIPRGTIGITSQPPSLKDFFNTGKNNRAKQ